MKYESFIIILLILVGCRQSETKDSSNINILTSNEINSSFQNAEIHIGDSILLYGDNNEVLTIGITGDTCKAVVKDIFYSKPTGKIAFIEFENYDAHNTSFSIDLYYIDSEFGYRETELSIWQRSLSKAEKKRLQEDWISEVNHFQIAQNLRFEVSKYED